MGDSPTPRAAEPSACVAVAYSGGRDSTALLHATARAALNLHEQGLAVQVVALHVHHGLNPQADAWLAHCRSQCEAWEQLGLPVRFAWRRLTGSPGVGESVEAWARQGRYQALEQMAAEAGASALLLAHHRRDQAETLLLQALRGGGVAGLAGMPREQQRGELSWLRPWIEQPRTVIESYIRLHGLSHVEDDSNSDPRFARNRLRLQVWPALEQAFGHAEASLAQAAQWAQQSLALHEEVAAEDAARWVTDGKLPIVALTQLSPARASNLLRHWLHDHMGHSPPATLVSRLTAQSVLAANGARWPAGEAWVQRHGGLLVWLFATGPVDATPPEQVLDLSGPGRREVPAWRGYWVVEEAGGDDAASVPASLLRNVRLRAREGGEQFQRAPGSPPRSLKKAWQSAGVPALMRGGPLLHGAVGLIHVPGLGLDARACALAAAPGEPRLRIDWRPAGGVA